MSCVVTSAKTQGGVSPFTDTVTHAPCQDLQKILDKIYTNGLSWNKRAQTVFMLPVRLKWSVLDTSFEKSEQSDMTDNAQKWRHPTTCTWHQQGNLI